MARGSIDCAYCHKTEEHLRRCSRCKRVFYCSKECQQKDWPSHKPTCQLPKSENEELSEQERMLKLHHQEFRSIISKYGLDKGRKAEEISSYLTDARTKEKVSPEEFGEQFGMSSDEASTFLSFVHIGLRFKEDVLDGSSQNLPTG